MSVEEDPDSLAFELEEILNNGDYGDYNADVWPAEPAEDEPVAPLGRGPDGVPVKP